MPIVTRSPQHPALRDAAPKVFWLDDPAAPPPAAPLDGDSEGDIAIVGAGFTGLWSALLAKQRTPSLDVVILEARRTAAAASGRNGGFCDASLTHGFSNGLSRFASELDTLDRMGLDNLDAIEATVATHHIDCGFERTGMLDVATAPWQYDELTDLAGVMREHGHRVDVLDAAALREEVVSPSYHGGIWVHGSTAIVNPARLAWGLRSACIDAGVRIHDGTPVRSLHRAGDRIRLDTPHGTITAKQVALATNADRPLLARLRPFILPVYDYVLVTEPLSAAQLDSIGWKHRQGIGDSGNQFHYYRLTADSRILWGGYDAIYHYGNRVAPKLEQRAATFDKLAGHFFATFPQLGGVRFTHRWGGAIDTCSRFCAFWGTSHGGRVAYALGYTGLGVGASRFGARVMLDLLDGEPTERTRLRLVRTRPVPFPPEPLRYGVVQLTRWSLDNADRNAGNRNLWLRTLDQLGLGFDS
ncbi:MAG TPA: FAD-dependent oxidoreductase [Candidatus Saccharimonadales bacterium]|nr:FAD-dependent oxidoreductase [Candidatus Saccharimonadales bacterium]